MVVFFAASDKKKSKYHWVGSFLRADCASFSSGPQYPVQDHHLALIELDGSIQTIKIVSLFLAAPSSKKSHLGQNALLVSIA